MTPQIQEETVKTNENPATVIKTTRTVSDEEIPGEHPVKTYEKKKAILRTYQVVWYILGVIEVVLAFRFILKAAGANPFSGFANLVYSISNPLALPFRGILQATVVGNSGFEWSTLLGMAVYAILAIGIVKLIEFAKPVTPDEVKQKVDYSM